MMGNKAMKKICSLLLSLMILIGAVMGISSCSPAGDPPALEDVYDRIVTVVEASHEVNVLLFGAGLPVYPREGAEEELVHRYYGVADDGREYVTPYTKYKSIAEMQTAIAAVYSVQYRESLYETLFTGYADGDILSTMPARFQEDERALYQSKYVESLVNGVRVYDYAAMEIVDGSNATRIRVAIPSYSESKPDVWTTVTLAFVFENGDWYLDSPSC